MMQRNLAGILFAGFALAVGVVLGTGVGAAVASPAQQTVQGGVLPLLFHPAFKGAGISTDALVGKYCHTVVKDDDSLTITCTDSAGEDLAAVEVELAPAGGFTLPDGGVTEPKLASGAVSNRALGEAAVSEPKLASGSVNSRAVQDGSLRNVDHQSNSIDTTVLKDLGVHTPELYDCAVTGP